MKPTLDQGAVAALAAAALFASTPEYGDGDPDCRTPERIARTSLDAEAIVASDDEIELVATRFDHAFVFGLQLGARIGADPLQCPDVNDLVEKYRG